MSEGGKGKQKIQKVGEEKNGAIKLCKVSKCVRKKYSKLLDVTKQWGR